MPFKYEELDLNVRVQASWFQISLIAQSDVESHEDGHVASTRKWALCGKQRQQSESLCFRSCMSAAVRLWLMITSVFTIHGFSDLPEEGRCHSTVGVSDCRCAKKKTKEKKKIPINSFQLWNQNHHGNTLNEYIRIKYLRWERKLRPQGTGKLCRDWSLQ